MALHLDSRQRAMLLEMGVRVWLPGTAFDTQPPLLALARTPSPPAHAARGLAAAPPKALGASTASAQATQPTQPTKTAQLQALHAPQGAGGAVLGADPLPAAHVLGAQAGAASVGTASAGAGGVLVLPDLAGLDWAAVSATCADCRACSLWSGRQRSTLGAHSPVQADWLVVGEPPDEAEDSAAQPFAGDEGVLLANMLRAVGVQRGGQGALGAYATNVVKCRPPHGRNPQPADLAQCAAYLEREIAQVQPKVILALGRFAIATLLREHGTLTTQPLGKLRGTVYRFQGIAVVVSYHPKLLLRNSADKAKAWADLCLALDCLDAA